MARVQVFVDDAVRGDLPSVCVKTGVPTNRFVEHRGTAGRSWPWFLFFVIGLWALLLSSEETFDVFLPLSREVSDAQQRRRWDRRAVWAATAGGVLLVGLYAQLTGSDTGATALVVVGVGLVATLVTSWRLDALSVGVSLDATRRWVVLDGVHPSFARAVHDAGQAEHRTVR